MEKIIVKEIHKRMTDSGLVIPDNATQEKRGIIVAIGTGDIKDGKIVPFVVNVDDIVVWFPFTGHAMMIDGEEYVILRQSDIIGVIPPVEKSILTKRGNYMLKHI